MIKLLKTRIIWVTILVIATLTSGCLPQATISSETTNEETIPIINVTLASTETSIPTILTPTSTMEGNGGGDLINSDTSEVITDWWGVIKSNPPGAQFDDYFERRDLGQIINYGIDSIDPNINIQIKELRDSGKTVHLYGFLNSNIPDVNGSQIQPNLIEVSDAAGGWIPPGTTEPISDWWGVIKSTPPGAQFDDYFERQDLGQVIYFGIDSLDPKVKTQIETLRDSGKIVHLYGTLFSNVPDYNGSQVQVDRIEY
ncbi:MAG: hypothetical protein Q8S01_02885 [Ignavibacteria bacterium]|nr:hypothetical protein [Ignavibacteria bacterium]